MNVIQPSKKSPGSGRLYRVVENRTPDTDQIINYSLETYSPASDKWFSLKTGSKAGMEKEYTELTGAGIPAPSPF